MLRHPRSIPRSLAHATLLLLAITLAPSPTTGAYTPASISADQEEQDVFLQCLSSMYHADRDGDNQLDRTEYRAFAEEFSDQLYPHPIFSNDGYFTNEMRDLFKLLVQASGGDYYTDININVYGSKVQDLMHVDQERFDQLHKTCRMTENAFSLLAKKTKAPKTMVMEFTMVDGNLGDEDGVIVKIKPVLKDGGGSGGSDSSGGEQSESDSSSDSEDLELHGTHISKHKPSDNAVPEPEPQPADPSSDSVEEEDDIFEVIGEYYNSTNSSSSTSDSEDSTDSSDSYGSESSESVEEVYVEAYRDAVYKKNKDKLQNAHAKKAQEQALKHQEVLDQKEAARAKEKGSHTQKHPHDATAPSLSPTMLPTFEPSMDPNHLTQDTQDHIDSFEEDIFDLTLNQTVLVEAKASSNNEDFVEERWDEEYREEQFQKNQAELGELQEALLMQKQTLAQQKEEAQDALKKTLSVSDNSTSDDADWLGGSSSSDESDDASIGNETKPVAISSATTSDSDEDDESEDSSEEEVGISDASDSDEEEEAASKPHHGPKHAPPKKQNITATNANTKPGHGPHHGPKHPPTKNNKKTGQTANQPSASYSSSSSSSSSDEDEDEIETGLGLNAFYDKDALEDILEDFDELDEAGSEDIQILSIHTSFIIFNSENTAAADIDISENSTLDHAFEDFVVLITGTVCDKAGLARSFGNCSGVSQAINTEQEQEEKEDEGSQRRRLLGSSTDGERPQRNLNGAEFHERQGMNFAYTVMNPELYDIEDMDCPMEGEFLCQTVFAHYNLLLSGLDGDLRQIEHNYMIITAKGIEHGRLRDSLQMIAPLSPHHVEGVGIRAFPSVHPHTPQRDVVLHHSIQKKANAPQPPAKKKDDQNDRQEHQLPEPDPDDPNWELLLSQQGYHPNPTGLYAEDEYDNQLLGSVGAGSVVVKTVTGQGASSCRLLTTVIPVFLLTSLVVLALVS